MGTLFGSSCTKKHANCKLLQFHFLCCIQWYYLLQNCSIDAGNQRRIEEGSRSLSRQCFCKGWYHIVRSVVLPISFGVKRVHCFWGDTKSFQFFSSRNLFRFPYFQIKQHHEVSFKVQIAAIIFCISAKKYHLSLITNMPTWSKVFIQRIWINKSRNQLQNLYPYIISPPTPLDSFLRRNRCSKLY